jgi:hypothetical protein
LTYGDVEIVEQGGERYYKRVETYDEGVERSETSTWYAVISRAYVRMLICALNGRLLMYSAKPIVSCPSRRRQKEAFPSVRRPFLRDFPPAPNQRRLPPGAREG